MKPKKRASSMNQLDSEGLRKEMSRRKTPIVILLSARLNAGNVPNRIKSTTAPYWTRSMIFPKDPPITRAKPISIRGVLGCIRRDEKKRMTVRMTAVTRARVPVKGREKAMPSLKVLNHSG